MYDIDTQSFLESGDEGSPDRNLVNRTGVSLWSKRQHVKRLRFILF